MHSGLPHSILPFPLLTNNVKSQLFWNRHKAWMITSSPRTAFSSAISDCIPNTAFHSSLPSETRAIWREKNGDVCLCGWWEADISHMAFLAAVMQWHKLFPLLLPPLCYKSVKAPTTELSPRATASDLKIKEATRRRVFQKQLASQ